MVPHCGFDLHFSDNEWCLLSNLKAVSLLFSKTKPMILAYLCQSVVFIFPTISYIFSFCLFPLRWQGRLLPLLKRGHVLILLLPKFSSFHCQPSWKNSLCSWNSFLLFPLSSWTPANRLLPSPSQWTILTKATSDPTHYSPSSLLWICPASTPKEWASYP